MRMIVLLLALIALAAPAQAAQKTHPRHDSPSLEQKCREMVEACAAFPAAAERRTSGISQVTG